KQPCPCRAMQPTKRGARLARRGDRKIARGALASTIAETDEPWTTRKLLRWTTRRFEERGLESPRVRAEMLLAHVLRTERLRLYMEAERPASPDELADFRGLVKRALRHEPVDHLVGTTPFFTLTLEVSPAVLVPRPSTEALVEHVLQAVRARAEREEEAEAPAEAKPRPGGDAPADRGPADAETAAVRGAGPVRVADVGTGSGAIALALLKSLPEASAVATDVSADALGVAARNAQRLGLAGRVDFREGSLLEPLAGERFDWLVSNPPYIPDAEWDAVEPGVKDHEPTLALRGGPDGLDLLRPLIAGAAGVLAPGGRAAFELAASHADAALELAVAAGWADAAVLPDHERLPRVLVGCPGG
ncbi:N5-glutamine methyltransferase family protein, partial [Phycisphaera mikurensis]